MFALVRKILEPRDEARLTYDDLQQIFPKWTRRPVDLCPVVIPRLVELAEKAETKLRDREAAAEGSPA